MKRWCSVERCHVLVGVVFGMAAEEVVSRLQPTRIAQFSNSRAQRCRIEYGECLLSRAMLSIFR